MSRKYLECDTVIIGAGSAGLEAFKAAQENGALCVIVDSGPLGTSAQRNGDLPLSLLMAAGMARRAVDELESFGIEVAETGSFNNKNVLNSLRQIRSRATSEVLSFLYRIPEERRLRGQARFIDKNRLEVADEYVVVFKTAVIATGSSPLVTYEQSRLKGILTANKFFELDAIPQSAAIFGSTQMGMQLGQALAYLGVDVAVFGQRKLWELTDENVLTTAHRMLSRRFNLYCDTVITSIEADRKGYAIYYIDDRRFENYLHMDSIIAATDRIPNVGGMNLQDIGIKLNHNGCVSADPDTLQTSVPNIFAAGDVCHDAQETTVAIFEGRYAGRNAALYPNVRAKPRTVRLSIVHTDPVLALVGLTLNEMKERAQDGGPHFLATELKLDSGQYREQRGEGGILSLYTDVASRRILGAEICAVGGEHIAQFLAVFIQKNATVDELAEAGFYHLSVENAISEACREAVRVLNSGSAALSL